MRQLPAGIAIAVFTAVILPVTARAQIVRTPTPPSATMPVDTTGKVSPDTLVRPPADLTPFERARFEQIEFEAFRHIHLPADRSSSSNNCDERVGRFCYWYDESQPMPKEPEVVRVRRDGLTAALDSLARTAPRNIWIAEQRVRYLAESKRYTDALAAARACESDEAGNDWRCEILVGFSQHLLGEYAAAERTYDGAISRMDLKESCEWLDLSLLLDDVARAEYRDLKCGDPARDAWAARTWFLARTLYSMKGNDSRTEYFARMTMVQMLKDAVGAYEFGFDADERELLLRFGWPRAWAAQQLSFFVASTTPIKPGGTGGGGRAGPNVAGPKGTGRGGTPVGSLPPGTKVPGGVPPLVRPPDMPGNGGLPGGLGGAPDNRPTFPRLPGVEIRPRGGDRINVIGIEPFPAYRYIPAGFVLSDPPRSDSAAWRLQLPPVMARYAPVYAKSLVPLEHQRAVFKRGDSAIVVMAYQTAGTKSVEGARIRAGLVVTPAGANPRDYSALLDSAPATGVLTVLAPWGPLLMSAEVVAAERNAVARARYGVGPMRGPDLRVKLSDLLFYTPYDATPRSVEDVAPHALPTERIQATARLGVYWEAYGTDPGGEPIKASLVVAREDPVEEGGFFKRLAKSLRLAGDATPVSVTIQDLSTVGSTTTSRPIEFDISTLSKGSYIVQLELEVAGQPVLRTEHRIEVVGP